MISKIKGFHLVCTVETKVASVERGGGGGGGLGPLSSKKNGCKAVSSKKIVSDMA